MRTALKSEMTQKIKETLKEHEINLVGIAPRDKFNDAPLKHHPRNLMPNFESIIALGIGWKIRQNPQGWINFIGQLKLLTHLIHP